MMHMVMSNAEVIDDKSNRSQISYGGENLFF